MCGVNKKKTNIVHFRPNDTPCNNNHFNLGPLVLDFKSEYVYLGILFTEHLNLVKSVKRLCSVAHRALALLNNKSRRLPSRHFPTSLSLHCDPTALNFSEI
eukprot:Lithocolla_globosa_v1_NODE_10413_length_601_cov_71.157509.p1 type:complete len:101 gc:universal NODE_10413_length_601_cov_71.157509:551-249(-)